MIQMINQIDRKSELSRAEQQMELILPVKF